MLKKQSWRFIFLQVNKNKNTLIVTNYNIQAKYCISIQYISFITSEGHQGSGKTELTQVAMWYILVCCIMMNKHFIAKSYSHLLVDRCCKMDSLHFSINLSLQIFILYLHHFKCKYVSEHWSLWATPICPGVSGVTHPLIL